MAGDDAGIVAAAAVERGFGPAGGERAGGERARVANAVGASHATVPPASRVHTRYEEPVPAVRPYSHSSTVDRSRPAATLRSGVLGTKIQLGTESGLYSNHSATGDAAVPRPNTCAE